MEAVLFHKSIRVVVMHRCEVGHHQARAFSSVHSAIVRHKTGEACYISGAKTSSFYLTFVCFHFRSL